MPRVCADCGEIIPPKRLEALPHTRYCVNCSQEEPLKGHMSWEHKTAPTFSIVSPKAHEWLQANKRTGTHAKLPMEKKRTNGL